MSVRVDEFELRNVGTGEDPFSLREGASQPETDAIVLLLQRDYHCRECRKQVQDVAARYDEFTAANALVVSVVPESVDRTQNWQESYDLPFPLLADPAKTLGDEYDQPTRFGVLGRLHDLIGRMPEAIVIDTRDDELTTSYVHEGTSPADRPSIDDLLEQVNGLH